jgi:putative ABC transport system ATP-binding protein
VSDELVLELDGVTKVYGEQPPVAALRGVSLSVRRGELVAIVGPSGSGKSTLLHVIGTLERPSSGVVRIGGVDAARLDDRELSRLRARQIGFVFQQFFLAEHATVRENVADGLLYAGALAAERYRRADEALERVGLSHRASFKPTKLSGGSGSGLRSPAPSSGARRSCSPTNRPGASTAPPAHRSWSSSASSTLPARPSS